MSSRRRVVVVVIVIALEWEWAGRRKPIGNERSRQAGDSQRAGAGYTKIESRIPGVYHLVETAFSRISRTTLFISARSSLARTAHRVALQNIFNTTTVAIRPRNGNDNGCFSVRRTTPHWGMIRRNESRVVCGIRVLWYLAISGRASSADIEPHGDH